MNTDQDSECLCNLTLFLVRYYLLAYYTLFRIPNFYTICYNVLWPMIFISFLSKTVMTSGVWYCVWLEVRTWNHSFSQKVKKERWGPVKLRKTNLLSATLSSLSRCLFIFPFAHLIHSVFSVYCKWTPPCSGTVVWSVSLYNISNEIGLRLNGLIHISFPFLSVDFWASGESMRFSVTITNPPLLGTSRVGSYRLNPSPKRSNYPRGVEPMTRGAVSSPPNPGPERLEPFGGAHSSRMNVIGWHELLFHILSRWCFLYLWFWMSRDS